MLRFIVHYGSHLIFPLIFALIFYPKQWKNVYLIFLGAMLIDLDHLLVNPIFDPGRCSIGFHLLHSAYAIIGYCFMLFFSSIRVFGIALLWHIITDLIDCWMM